MIRLHGLTLLIKERRGNILNRKFISIAASAAMICKVLVPLSGNAAASEKNIYSCDFSDPADSQAYVLYDETNKEGNIFISEDGRLAAQMGAEHGWNENNGLKINASDYLKAAAANSLVTVSMDFTSTWWGELSKAKLFFETVTAGGKKQTIICEGPEKVSSNDETVKLTGSVENFSYEVGTDVYLCVTQPSGMCYIDNVVISCSTAEEKPSETAAATELPENDELFNDDFSDNDLTGYSVYDDTDTGAQLSADGNASITFGNSWSESNGIKKNITSYVKSGSKYSVSADVFSSWWGGTPAKLFFEVVGANGKTKTAISEAVGEGNEGSIALYGSGDIRFAEGDTVYLCITQAAGYGNYDNITMKYIGESAEATAGPENTAKPSPPADEVFNDDFSDNNLIGYSVYDDTDTAAEMSADGKAEITFGNSWSESNGIKKNITSYVKSGLKYSVSADVYSSWWGETPAKLFFEVAGANGKTKTAIAEAVGAGNDGSVTLSGSGDIRFAEGDTVYLCITQAAGYGNYDNITMKYIGEADPEPTEGPDNTSEPTEGPEPTPAVEPVFKDEFSDNSAVGSYGIYDSRNTTYTIGIDDGKLSAAMGEGHDWDGSNGVRKDITDIVKNYTSGVTFGAAADVLTYYWGDASAKLFFEVVSKNGAVTSAAIAEGQPANGGDTASLRGSAMLNYNEGDSVYLCITHNSGNHTYDNISMWLENPYAEGVVPLTSGKNYAGTYFPQNADAVMKHTFGGNADTEMAQYTVYSGSFSTDPYVNDGSAVFTFSEDSNTIHAVELDVTEALDKAVPNGGRVRISYKIKPWWWWGNATLRLVTGGTRTKLVSETPADQSTEKFTTISAETDITRTPGETAKIIIGMDSASATGLAFDDVAIEIPYDMLQVKDIAVSDISKLSEINTVNVVYGGQYAAKAGVSWDVSDSNARIVYGKTEIEGVTARAVVTDKAVKLTASANGVKQEAETLEYGKAVTAENGELAFLVDDMEHLNLISSVMGGEPAKGTADTAAAMRVRDNGSGFTIEGCVPEAANSEQVILILNEQEVPVKVEYIAVASDGKYSVSDSGLATGSYRAVMTDTLADADFSYAAASEFEKLKAEINGGKSLAELLDSGADAARNRIILGANSYAALDKLASKQKVYSAFSKELGSKTRSEAIALFDALVTVYGTEAAISTEEWTELLELSAEKTDIKGTNIYEVYIGMSNKDKTSVKSKTDARSADNVDEFRDAFIGSALNTALMNAGYYTNVQTILKNNADLFDSVNTKNISSAEAKYILNHISASDTTISSISSLIKEAESNADSGSSSGGGGGGSSSSRNNGSGLKGTNIGGYTTPFIPTPAPVLPQPLPSSRFSDLAGYSWAENAIYSLCDKGIVNGYGDGSFAPGENITREAFVKLIVSAFGIEQGDSSAEFSDVAADRWSHDVISAAAAADVVTGVSDTEFAPERNITRQDAAVMIYRALLYKDKEVSEGTLSFTDADSISDYAQTAVGALCASGIINGMENGSFSPFDNTSRAQAAVMIYRAVTTLL